LKKEIRMNIFLKDRSLFMAKTLNEGENKGEMSIYLYIQALLGKDGPVPCVCTDSLCKAFRKQV
jgi:hypothetical protein